VRVLTLPRAVRHAQHILAAAGEELMIGLQVRAVHQKRGRGLQSWPLPRRSPAARPRADPIRAVPRPHRDSRRELEAEQGEKSKNMLGVTAAVGVAAADRDVALVIEQLVKGMQGFACRRPPDPWGRSRCSRWTRTKAKKLVLRITNLSLPSSLHTKGGGRVGVLLSLQIFIRFKVGGSPEEP